MNKILTFDCYGTLLNTTPLYNYIGRIAELNNLPGEKAIGIFSSYEDRLMYGEKFITYDKLIYEILTYCDMELSANIFSSHCNDIIEIYKCFLPFPDVMNTLRELKRKGYELAIMSNSTFDIMNSHLEKLENIFDNSLVAEETKCYKPDLQFFEIAQRKFNLAQKEHWHIAKGYWWDIVPAARMGWNKIWVNRTHILTGRESEKPYSTILSLDELNQLL